MHISSIIILEGELEYDEVFAHFAQRMHHLPACRRKLAQVPLNLAHPTWVDDPDYDLKNHLIDHPLTPGTSLDAAIAAAVAANEPMLDRSKPLWAAHVIRGVPGKTLMLHQTHHCMIDGASGVEMMAIMYDFDDESPSPEAPTQAWTPEALPDPLTLFNEALTENIAALSKVDWSAQLAAPTSERQSMMQRAGRVMSDFVTRPVVTAPFNAGIVGPSRDLAWMRKSFDEIREVRRALGGTINDIVLTIVSEAVAEYLANNNENTNDQHMRIMCPVNVRTEDQKGTLGNRVSAIFPVLPAWRMPTRQRLSTVISETERIKQNQDAQALTLMQESAVVEPWPIALWPSQLVGTPFDPTALAAAMPMPVMPNLGVRPPNIGYNFTCTNVPGAQVPQYLAGHVVTDQIGLLILNGNVGFSVTILSYNKTLFFGFICEPRLLPKIQDIADSAEAAFATLLDAAREHTASLQQA